MHPYILHSAVPSDMVVFLLKSVNAADQYNYATCWYYCAAANSLGLVLLGNYPNTLHYRSCLSIHLPLLHGLLTPKQKGVEKPVNTG